MQFAEDVANKVENLVSIMENENKKNSDTECLISNGLRSKKCCIKNYKEIF